MSLDQLLQEWRGSPRIMGNVAAWRTLAAQPARTESLPPGLDERLAAVLASRGIDRLYTHQAQAWAAAQAGSHLAIVTPTASGKTLCYNLPILHRLLNDGEGCALYLFPTKALAQDQLAELGRWAAQLERHLQEVATFLTPYLRWRHALRRTPAHPQDGAAAAHESGHAAHGHPALSYTVGGVSGWAALRGD